MREVIIIIILEIKINHEHCYIYDCFIAAPGSSPASISAETVSATEIKVSWTPPPANTHNGILTEYIICFREVNDESCRFLSNLDATTEHLWVIQGELSPDTLYRIRVRAVNSAGGGPYTQDLMIRTGRKRIIISSFLKYHVVCSK